jgi:hypothetical protein
MSVRAGLESWLVEDGKVGPLRRGDVLVSGLEIFVHELSFAEPGAVVRPIRHLADATDPSGNNGAIYEIVGQPVVAEWCRGDMWLLEASGIQFALTGPNPLPPTPSSAVVVRGSVWVPWGYLHRGPLTRPWRVEKIFVQTMPANGEARPTPESTWTDANRYEVDHIDHWPVGVDHVPYQYLLDLAPLDYVPVASEPVVTESATPSQDVAVPAEGLKFMSTEQYLSAGPGQ